MTYNIVGSPATGENFYGRDDFVRQVSERLQTGGSILLAAPRRFGKTIVMYRLMQQPAWQHHTVHVDLEGLSHPVEFLTRLIEGTAKLKLPAYTRIVAQLNDAAKALADLVCDNVEEFEINGARVKLRDTLSADWREQARSFMRSVAAVGEPVVFFLDELPMLLDWLCQTPQGKEEAMALMRWFRELRQNPDLRNLRFVLAGSIGIDRILNGIGQIATINDFERMKLQPFSHPVAEQFLAVLAQTHELPLFPTARDSMLECIGAPVPYFLQILFSEARKYYAEHNSPLDAAAIQKIYRDNVLGADCKTYFHHYYTRLNDYYDSHLARASKAILRELAQARQMSRDACWQIYRTNAGERAEFDAFIDLMTELEYEFYVVFEDNPGRYRFSCKLLSDWWLRHYGL